LKDSDQLLGMNSSEKEKVKKYAGMDDAGARKTLNDADIGKTLAEAAAAPKDGWVVEIRGYTYRQPKSEEFLEATLIENLKYPERLKDTPMNQALIKNIKERVGYFHLYRRKPVQNPVPGHFEIITTSYLAPLIKGDVQMGAGPGPAGPGPAGPGRGEMMPGAGGDKDKPSRDAWRPIGEQASATIGAGGGGFGGPGVGAGPGPGPGAVFQPGVEGGKKALPPVPRYEFVIVFVWREPLGPETPAAVAGGPNAPAIPTTPGSPIPADKKN
jgi:hypothetical protein